MKFNLNRLAGQGCDGFCFANQFIDMAGVVIICVDGCKHRIAGCDVGINRDGKGKE